MDYAPDPASTDPPHLVEREGPDSRYMGLARRVAQEHGWQRTGKRIQAQVQSNLSLVERRYWNSRPCLSGFPEAILTGYPVPGAERSLNSRHFPRRKSVLGH